jgi:DNA-binding transcriptional regulator GbsR (MarR family)
MLGLPRSTGQIYGLLYLSPKPLSLDDIATLLSISKASASTGTRQLATWQAVKEVWVPGDRRDHFEALGDLRELLRAGYRNFFQPKFEKSQRKLDVLLTTLEADHQAGLVTPADYAFSRERLNNLGKLQDKLENILPLAERFL